MKLARWKVLSLAGALALGYVVSADAAQIKVSDETWANFGLNMKVMYQNLDKRSNATDKGGWHQNVFDVTNTQLYFKGQVTPLFQFYIELENDGRDGTTTIDDAGINLAFAKEFQVLAGELRKPFTRAQLTSSYAYLMPKGFWLDPQSALGPIRDSIKNNKDGGLMVHGDLADGMFRYKIGVFNENRDLNKKLWANKWVEFKDFTNFNILIDTSTDYLYVNKIKQFGIFEISGTKYLIGKKSDTKANNLKNFEWNARIEFTPTMLGFKPESAATITPTVPETYLGSKDVLTIGFGYHTATHTSKATIYELDQILPGMYYATPIDNISDLKRKGWTVDAMFEKKYGNLVPNLQIGYISLSDTHYYIKYAWDKENNVWDISNVKKGDADIWYVAGQLLFDQCVWLGKPAIAFRYEKFTGDGQWTNGTILKKDLTAENISLAFNYYIKGQAARISLGFDQTKYKDALKYFLKYGDPNTKKEDSITDWYVYFQSMF
jgi:hypothetical protein